MNRRIGRRIVGVVAALLVASACNAVSDDFHAATLNSSTWTVENPVGDGSVSVNGHALVLSVPGGTEHDMWSTGLHGLRVVESTPNADFEVESKFESIGAAQFQDEGIVVEQDASTILRFDVFNAGGGQIILFAASVSGGTAAVKVSTTLTPSPAAPFWLRVKRTGSTWLFTYSRDGINWELGGSFAFAMTVAKVGPYAGNSGTPSAGVDGDGRLLLQHREPGRPRRRRRRCDDDDRERRLQRGFVEHEQVELRESRRRFVTVDGRPARGDQRARGIVTRPERER